LLVLVNVSLFQAASALNASSRWQEVISENLASSSIPGYKKQDLSFAAIQAGLMPTTSSTPAVYALPRAQQTTSFNPGEIKATGSKTDVAIEGPGFFEIQLPSGSLAYTRDGEFQISNQGQLVTKAGQPVMGSAGPIELDKSDPGAISIAATGVVSQGEIVKGNIKIVDFNDPQLLTPMGNGHFIGNSADLHSYEVTAPSLRQGYLEASNTSSVMEMANLVTAMRSFEANQRVIQLQDERMGRAISELGTPN
jgi:flagellar basal-body rod protein FlgF